MLWSAHSASLSAEPSPFLLLSITVLLPRVGGKAQSHTWMHSLKHTLTDIDINRCTMQLSHVQSGWKLKNRSFLCHPMSEVGAVFMQTSRAKNHPDISFCMPTMWPTLPPPTSAMYARHHLSTGHPPPYTLLHSTQTPSTTRDQASVRDGLAIDTKCGTKCRKGAPQTHT